MSGLITRIVKATLLAPLLGMLSTHGVPFYDGYSDDRAALRRTYRLGTPSLNASSAAAVNAARRLFAKVPFVGMTRKEALVILGDPRTISDYGIAASPTQDSPLVYRFDSGYGGYQFTLQFHASRVTKVVEEGPE